MCTQESGNAVRRQDGAQGRPVLRVGLKHLLHQIVELVGQVTGQGRVRTPTHLEDQALPAGRLELNTGVRCEELNGQNKTVSVFSERKERAYRVTQGAELVENAAQRPHVTAGDIDTRSFLDFRHSSCTGTTTTAMKPLLS